MTKNILLKSLHISLFGMMMGPLAPVPIWAMENISDDSLEQIFTYLPPKTLVHLPVVCKRWKELSEQDRLWQVYGVRSKKECVEFPFPMLEREHLEVLFKHNYVSGNGLFFWTLVGDIKKPYELMQQIPPKPLFGKPTIWEAEDIKCTKKELNSLHYTMILKFIYEKMKMRLISHSVPYMLTLKGSWSKVNMAESENEGIFFPKLTLESLMKIIKLKRSSWTSMGSKRR